MQTLHRQAVLFAQADASGVDHGYTEKEKRSKEGLRINHKSWEAIDYGEVISA